MESTQIHADLQIPTAMAHGLAKGQKRCKVEILES